MGWKSAIESLKSECNSLELIAVSENKCEDEVDLKVVDTNFRVLFSETDKSAIEKEELISLFPVILNFLCSRNKDLRHTVNRYLPSFEDLLKTRGFNESDFGNVKDLDFLQKCNNKLLGIVDELSNDWIEPWLLLVRFTFAHFDNDSSKIQLNRLFGVIEKAFKRPKVTKESFEAPFEAWARFNSILAESHCLEKFLNSAKLLNILVLPFTSIKSQNADPYKLKTWFLVTEKIGLKSETAIVTIVAPFLHFLIHNRNVFSNYKDDVGTYLKTMSGNIYLISNYCSELLKCLDLAIEHGSIQNDIVLTWTTLCGHYSNCGKDRQYLLKLLNFLKNRPDNDEEQELLVQLCLAAYHNGLFDFKSLYIEDISLACEIVFPLVISSPLFLEKVYRKIQVEMSQMMENLVQDSEIVEDECMSPILSMWEVLIKVYTYYVDSSLDSRFVPTQLDISIICDLIILPLTRPLSSSDDKEESSLCVQLKSFLFSLNLKSKGDLFPQEFLTKLDNEIRSSRISLDSCLWLASCVTEINSGANIITLLHIILKSIANCNQPKIIMDFLRLVDSVCESMGQLTINFKAPLNFLRKFSSSYEPPYDLQIRQLARNLLKKIPESGEQKPSGAVNNESEGKKTNIRSPLVYSNFRSRLCKAEEKKSNKHILAASIFPRDSEKTGLNKENKECKNEKDTPKIKPLKTPEDVTNLSPVNDRFAKSSGFIVDISESSESNQTDNFEPKVAHFKVSTDFHKAATPPKMKGSNRILAGVSPKLESINKSLESESDKKIMSPHTDKLTAVSKSPNTPQSSSKSNYSYLDNNSLESQNFVFVPPKKKKSPLTKHQKEMMRKRREEIPALYQDLSQDTQNTNDLPTPDLSSTDHSSQESSGFTFGSAKDKPDSKERDSKEDKESITIHHEENAVFNKFEEEVNSSEENITDEKTLNDIDMKSKGFLSPRRLNFEGICSIETPINSEKGEGDTPPPRRLARRSTSKYRKNPDNESTAESPLETTVDSSDKLTADTANKPGLSADKSTVLTSLNDKTIGNKRRGRPSSKNKKNLDVPQISADNHSISENKMSPKLTRSRKHNTGINSKAKSEVENAIVTHVDVPVNIKSINETSKFASNGSILCGENCNQINSSEKGSVTSVKDKSLSDDMDSVINIVIGNADKLIISPSKLEIKQVENPKNNEITTPNKSNDIDNGKISKTEAASEGELMAVTNSPVEQSNRKENSLVNYEILSENVESKVIFDSLENANDNESSKSSNSVEETSQKLSSEMLKEMPAQLLSGDLEMAETVPMQRTPPSAETPNRRKRNKKFIQRVEFSPKLLRRGKVGVKLSPKGIKKTKSVKRKSLDLSQCNTPTQDNSEICKSIIEVDNQGKDIVSETVCSGADNPPPSVSKVSVDENMKNNSESEHESLQINVEDLNDSSNFNKAIVLYGENTVIVDKESSVNTDDLKVKVTENTELLKINCVEHIDENISCHLGANAKNVSSEQPTLKNDLIKDSVKISVNSKTSPTRIMKIMQLACKNVENKIDNNSDKDANCDAVNQRSYSYKNMSSPRASLIMKSLENRSNESNENDKAVSKVSVMTEEKDLNVNNGLYTPVKILDSEVSSPLSSKGKRKSFMKSPCDEKKTKLEVTTNLSPQNIEVTMPSLTKTKKVSLDNWLIKKGRANEVGCADPINIDEAITNSDELIADDDNHLISDSKIISHFADPPRSVEPDQLESTLVLRPEEISFESENQGLPSEIQERLEPESPSRWPKRIRKERTISDSYTTPIKRSRNDQKVTPTKRKLKQQKVTNELSPSKPYSFTNWPKGDCEVWIACQPTPPETKPVSAILKQRSLCSPPKTQLSPNTTPKKRVSFLDPVVSKGLLYSKDEMGGEVQHASSQSGKVTPARRRKLLVGESNVSTGDKVSCDSDVPLALSNISSDEVCNVEIVTSLDDAQNKEITEFHCSVITRTADQVSTALPSTNVNAFSTACEEATPKTDGVPSMDVDDKMTNVNEIEVSSVGADSKVTDNEKTASVSEFKEQDVCFIVENSNNLADSELTKSSIEEESIDIVEKVVGKSCLEHVTCVVEEVYDCSEHVVLSKTDEELFGLDDEIIMDSHILLKRKTVNDEDSETTVESTEISIIPYDDNDCTVSINSNVACQNESQNYENNLSECGENREKLSVNSENDVSIVAKESIKVEKSIPVENNLSFNQEDTEIDSSTASTSSETCESSVTLRQDETPTRDEEIIAVENSGSLITEYLNIVETLPKQKAIEMLSHLLVKASNKLNLLINSNELFKEN